MLISSLGNLKTIATISSDPSWKTEGEAIRKAGEEELAAVKAQAGADRIWGKAERSVSDSCSFLLLSPLRLLLLASLLPLIARMGW